ncbi:MAG: monovalent cation/H+ antiporter complex subunit F [Lachnospiraceae bacterium]
MSNAYHYLFLGCLIVLALILFLCLIRACLGPKVADRIVSINMMGTIVIVMIAILAIMLDESYLIDICIIYAMISFLAVIVLTKIYSGVYSEQHQDDESDQKGDK